jgi:lipoprotein-anchoring transpeptidase ErfK/SrfK
VANVARSSAHEDTMMPFTMALTFAVLLGQHPAAPQRSAPAASPVASQALQIQVMLDRAGFSPGTIDGRMGANTRRALEAYRKQHGNAAAPGEAVTKYRITDEDVAGPFDGNIPSDLVEQSKLPALGYRDEREALAERFHTTPALLQQLNPGATFAAGEEITVPNVEPLIVPAPVLASNPHPQPKGTSGRNAKAAAPEAPPKPDVTVTVSKSDSSLTVTDPAGHVVMYAPVTTGSEHDPLPIGEWKVTGVQFNPTFRYNPDLFWDADASHMKALLPSGPNNPVGLVWIDISKEHYGLHGTPEPVAIGKTESHGCVRLTNWDALKLAGLVKPGTKVIFTN